jgi:hypothetical protein
MPRSRHIYKAVIGLNGPMLPCIPTTKLGHASCHHWMNCGPTYGVAVGVPDAGVERRNGDSIVELVLVVMLACWRSLRGKRSGSHADT